MLRWGEKMDFIVKVFPIRTLRPPRCSRQPPKNCSTYLSGGRTHARDRPAWCSPARLNLAQAGASVVLFTASDVSVTGIGIHGGRLGRAIGPGAIRSVKGPAASLFRWSYGATGTAGGPQGPMG